MLEVHLSQDIALHQLHTQAIFLHSIFIHLYIDETKLTISEPGDANTKVNKFTSSSSIGDIFNLVLVATSPDKAVKIPGNIISFTTLWEDEKISSHSVTFLGSTSSQGSSNERSSRYLLVYNKILTCEQVLK